MQYHVDGSLVDADAATLPVDDRGLTAGDAVGEPLRVADGALVAWDAHADRLFDACDALGFDPEVDGAELRSRVEDTLAANTLDDALVWLSITRGCGQDHAGLPTVSRLRPPPDPDPTVVVTVEPLSVDRTPVTLQTVRTRPIRPAAVPSAPVTHNRLDAVRAQAELRRNAPPDDDPAVEALLLEGGHVVGGAASDPVFVSDDALRLPAVDEWPARTATRAVVRDFAAAEGLPIVEGSYTPADFRAADEAFVAEPTAGVRPIASIDGVDVGGGPVTHLLSHLFDERVVGTGD